MQRPTSDSVNARNMENELEINGIGNIDEFVGKMRRLQSIANEDDSMLGSGLLTPSQS